MACCVNSRKSVIIVGFSVTSVGEGVGEGAGELLSFTRLPKTQYNKCAIQLLLDCTYQ